MNLIQTINKVVNKENISTNKEIKEAQELNKRANIVSIGQIQLRTLKADAINAKTVNRPLEQQRPKNLMEELGVKYISGLSSNFIYPILNNNNSEWADETATATECNTEFNSISLKPRRLVSYVEYSRDVVLNPSSEVADSIQEDLINSVFEKVQGTMFNDIIPSSFTTTITDYNDIVDLEYKATINNISNGVYVVSPLAAKVLKAMKNGDTPIMNNGYIDGFKVYETSSLSGNTIILGDYSKLLLGQFGAGLDITVDSVTKAPKGIISLTINSYWDWGAIDANAFVFAQTSN